MTHVVAVIVLPVGQVRKRRPWETENVPKLSPALWLERGVSPGRLPRGQRSPPQPFSKGLRELLELASDPQSLAKGSYLSGLQDTG